MTIKEWLNSEQDYFTGVELYELHGDNSTLKNLFRIGKTCYSVKKLLESLQAIAEKEEPKPDEKQEEKFPPPILKLIRERSAMHTRMVLTEPISNEAIKARHALASEITGITKKLDRWYQFGELPEEDQQAPELPVNGWDLHNLFGNNRSYITKNKKSADKQEEVLKREQQNALIEVRLKAMNYGAIQE